MLLHLLCEEIFVADLSILISAANELLLIHLIWALFNLSAVVFRGRLPADDKVLIAIASPSWSLLHEGLHSHDGLIIDLTRASYEHLTVRLWTVHIWISVIVTCCVNHFPICVDLSIVILLRIIIGSLINKIRIITIERGHGIWWGDLIHVVIDHTDLLSTAVQIVVQLGSLVDVHHRTGQLVFALLLLWVLLLAERLLPRAFTSPPGSLVVESVWIRHLMDTVFLAVLANVGDRQRRHYLLVRIIRRLHLLRLLTFGWVDLL